MRSVALLALLLAVPVHAEIVITNNARVNSGASAVVSTGGNEVDEGGVIETGEANASANSVVRSDAGGGTAQIVTETTVNGVTQREERSELFDAGENIDITVSTSARALPKSIKTRATSSTSLEESSSAATSRSQNALTPERTFSYRLQTFFARLFSRFELLAWWRSE